MKHLTAMFIMVLLTCTTARAEWQPRTDNENEVQAHATISAMRQSHPAAAEFFEQAHAYAVFPTVTKAAFMFGFTYGTGLVIRADEVIGRCSLKTLDLGPQAGGSRFSQIIFFRDAAALDEFAKGRLEFSGKAGVSVVSLDATATPAHLPDVAIITMNRFGLIAQAAAGPTKFDYEPVETAN